MTEGSRKQEAHFHRCCRPLGAGPAGSSFQMPLTSPLSTSEWSLLPGQQPRDQVCPSPPKGPDTLLLLSSQFHPDAHRLGFVTRVPALPPTPRSFLAPRDVLIQKYP